MRKHLGSIMIFISLVGPGIISAIAGNDAGGITTWSVAGAEFGYSLFWTLIPLTILLIVTQEMCARMGVVTGKGLADLIRENFGLKMTVGLMVGLFIANFATTVSEFAGIAAASELLGFNRFLVVLFAGFFVLFMIIRVNYKSLEKAFLLMCLFYLTYIFSGFLAHPDWWYVAKSSITPVFSTDKNYWILLVGIIGTTIAPWMQFYLQASIVEKGVKMSDYIYSKWELIIGGIASNAISFFILLAAAATLFMYGIHITSAAEAAVALEPFAGPFAGLLFSVGLFAAAFFGAFILPLSTAYYVCEAFGWESGVNKKLHEAKEFYAVITLLIVPPMIMVLLPHVPLVPIIILAQVINGLMLPIILFAILHLVNNEKVMGEHVNAKGYNILCWICFGTLTLTTLIMVGIIVYGFFS